MTNNNQTINYLNQFLSNIAVSNIKMYNLHWNIVGVNFFTLHAKFQEYYEKLTDEFDVISERIKQLGGFPIASLNNYSSHSNVREIESRNYHSEEAIKEAINDFKQLHKIGSDIASYTSSIGDGVTSGLIGEFLTFLEKQVWMLEANIK